MAKTLWHARWASIFIAAVTLAACDGPVEGSEVSKSEYETKCIGSTERLKEDCEGKGIIWTAYIRSIDRDDDEIVVARENRLCGSDAFCLLTLELKEPIDGMWRDEEWIGQPIRFSGRLAPAGFLDSHPRVTSAVIHEVTAMSDRQKAALKEAKAREELETDVLRDCHYQASMANLDCSLITNEPVFAHEADKVWVRLVCEGTNGFGARVPAKVRCIRENGLTSIDLVWQ